MEPNRLNNTTVLITRPAHQAKPLVSLIERAGGKTILFPTIEIAPLKNPQLMECALSRLSETDIVIFVSANAVHHTMPYWNKNTSPTIIAIGPGTARALEQHSLPPNFLPENYSSEGLLNLNVLREPAEKKILICCGKNPKPLLKDELQKRGAAVTLAICYQRVCPKINDQQRAQIQKQPVDIIVSTSKESLQNLHAIFKPSGLSWLTRIPLLVINDAMVQEAKALGFHNQILVANNASDSAIFDALHDSPLLFS